MATFIQISDLHFGAEVPQAVEALLTHIAATRPAAVLCCGDYTMRARRHEWQASRAFLEKISVPVISIPGNHDIPAANQPFDRIFHPFRRYRKSISSDPEPHAQFADLEVVGLNTARAWGVPPTFDWSHGAVSVKQCATLPFRFSSDSGLRAVMIHHPLKAEAEQTRKLLRRNGLLLASLATAKVDLLLAGHFHRSFIDLMPLPMGEGNVVLSHVSTVFSHRTKGEPMGFHTLATGDQSVEITRHCFRDTQYEIDSTHAFKREGSIWSKASM
ncbi:3',5'-cyclic AMP phosphodiesterase CpdA [Haloferula luteola]|uniref:3',5'-cyclic AMP phosphodiesterase CpdA n=1 Tax=Haloferula luteola TaxID=595692 RepID=A0A840VD01_9BACT|nr:metallophosphoesterase [Haloferula luteola]MBB5351770.1 3',5'-cyclic AMP phosphodiesterase CpdA [Haloferula luteola]